MEKLKKSKSKGLDAQVEGRRQAKSAAKGVTANLPHPAKKKRKSSSYGNKVRSKTKVKKNAEESSDFDDRKSEISVAESEEQAKSIDENENDANTNSHNDMEESANKNADATDSKSLANSTIERYSIQQRVRIIEAFYENGSSSQNAFRALRDFFDQHNRPSMATIEKIVHKFEQTGSVGDVETSVHHARPVRSAEIIAVVRDSLAEEPSISTRLRAQQLNISRTSLIRILNMLEVQ